MSVIAEFSLPSSEFVLGKALRATSGLDVELDKMIPVSGRTIPYFWVVGEGREQFDTVLAESPTLTDFAAVDELDGRTLYRVEWDTSTDSFVRAMENTDAVLLDAFGDVDSWTFRLRFPDSHALSTFHTTCREANVDITVERLYNPIDPTFSGTKDMTDAQRELVERAYDEGYFDVPRKITLAELAEKIGVSDQAVNERLRRGLRSLIGATVKSETRLTE